MQTAEETQVKSQAENNDAPSFNMAAFVFVQELTRELNKGAIELPSFPDIAMKVKKVLEDDNTTLDTIGRVVSSEPGLASRVLKMANSAANKRSDQPIMDVKRAVARLGHSAIRALAISFAMKNMMDTRKVAALKGHLNHLWNHSIHVAAIARCLAQRAGTVDPDEAMFVGLIHDVGKLYILTRIEHHSELFDSDESINQVLADWHVAIGQSIVENWDFGPALVEAVSEHEDDDRRATGPLELVDVLCAANTLCKALEDKTITEMDFDACGPFKRVALTADAYAELMEESKEEISAMMSALNG
ncbi:MAG: HDOD domain-containing protein [Gammaproteobacteria bacterium]